MLIRKISQFPKIHIISQLKIFRNFQNLTIWEIEKFFNFTIWKIDILQYQKSLNILGVRIIFSRMKKKDRK